MDEINQYHESLTFLYSFVDFSLTHQEQIAPERFELERMFELLERLGNPQQRYPAIHIAGTKGKGSVAAHCAAGLQAAGYRTGLYTSPHLQDFRERIQITGEMIPQADFISGVDALREVIPQVPGLTSYELQTALAFWYFAKQEISCAVVEVGMGGRLDSTNVLTPLVSVITNISYDHTAILGNTLAEIAGEKGGIIKPGVPVVCAPQQPEALKVLSRLASERGCEFILVGRDIKAEPVSASLDGQTFRVLQPGQEDLLLTTRLLGRHQMENGLAALAALQLVGKAGLTIPVESVQQGFTEVCWPGRFEVLEGKPQVVFDGAHNRHSIKMLAETLQDYFFGRKIVVVFGASEDKDIAGMFAELLPKTAHLLLVRADHPRAAPVERLARLASGYDCQTVIVEDPNDVRVLASEAAGEDGVVLVTGSLYLVGELRPHWQQK